MCEIKLLVTDMDGTFLGKHTTLLEDNCKALREAEQAGITVAFASGRLPSVLSRLALEAGLRHCRILGLNGAHTLDDISGRTQDLFPLSSTALSACLEALRVEDLRCNLYTDRGVYTDRYFTADREERFRAAFRNSCRVVAGPNALAEAEADIPLKLLVHGEGRPEALFRLEQAVRSLNGIALTAAKADTLEIMSASSGKGIAVERLARQLSVPPEQIMAIGDYDNDLDMLRFCGCSVAMGNAPETVAKACRYQTGSCEAMGFAAAVRNALSGKWS